MALSYVLLLAAAPLVFQWPQYINFLMPGLAIKSVQCAMDFTYCQLELSHFNQKSAVLKIHLTSNKKVQILDYYINFMVNTCIIKIYTCKLWFYNCMLVIYTCKLLIYSLRCQFRPGRCQFILLRCQFTLVGCEYTVVILKFVVE
jgi:hypothetical protein